MEDDINYLEDIETVNIKDLFESHIFEVPDNQRPYSWEIDHWLELWDDIIEMVNARHEKKENLDYFHFFGPMFFIQKDVENRKELQILDGQQRIATLGVVLRVIYNLLNFERDKYKISEAGSKVMGNISNLLFDNSPEKLRIKIGQSEEYFYNDIISPKVPNANPITQLDKLNSKLKLVTARNKPVIKEILNCYKFFLNKVVKELSVNLNTKIEENEKLNEQLLEKIFKRETEECDLFLSELFESISDGLYVLQVKVPDANVAYEMFETLNQRGQKLLVTDLFKNLIFDQYKKRKFESAECVDFWNTLYGMSGDNLDEFLHHFWISKYEFARVKNLFRKISSKIKSQSANEFRSLLNQILIEASIYFALRNPQSTIWFNREDISQKLDELNYLHFRQGLPLLLSSYVVCSENNINDFKELLNIYLNFCVRSYTILKGNPNELEEEYSKWSIQIRENESSIKKVSKEIKDKMPEDDEFESGFKENEFSPAVGRYIVTKINDALCDDKLKMAWNNHPTLEHIIPKNPDASWIKILKSEGMKHEDYINRLGNMTILSKDINSELGNLPYKSKYEKYQKNGLPINIESFKEISKSKFDKNEIKKREVVLGKLAIGKKIW